MIGQTKLFINLTKEYFKCLYILDSKIYVHSRVNNENVYYLEAYDNKYVIKTHSSGPRNRIKKNNKPTEAKL